jgi:hypothetical protein
MSAVLYGLTGVGGPWAQDPPYYAEVVAFETGPERDWAHIRLAGWRGWQHDRWIYFYHNSGPVVVVDEARGPVGAKSALVWHLVGGEEVAPRRFHLRSGDAPVEMVLVPVDGGGVWERDDEDAGVRIQHFGQSGFRVAAVLLFGEWTEAEITNTAARSREF